MNLRHNMLRKIKIPALSFKEQIILLTNQVAVAKYLDLFQCI